jgi:hypothetical protein
MATKDAKRTKSVRNSALFFAAVALAFYGGFILLGVLRS